VRGVALLLGCLVASCAPDYGHSAFRCDAEHGCPSGQTCILDRCRRADPIGNGSGDGVICGGRACALTEQCCLDEDNRTASCAAAGDVCVATSALCDGKEDCAGDDRCCIQGDTITCGTDCKAYACREDGDCPAPQHCCLATADRWGECDESC